jgi:hypothetical protein
MHRVDGAGNVSGAFTEGTPGVQEATVVTDDWLNDLQENICMAIEGAGMTLTKGDATQLLLAIGALITNVAKTYVAKQTFNGAAGDTSGALATTSVPTNFKLIWEGSTTASGKTRLYHAAGAGVVFTTNAAWNGTNWTPDVTGIASAHYLTDGYQRTRYNGSATAATPFADGAWTNAATLTTAGEMVLNGTAYPRTNPALNVLTKDNMPKAWATWDVNGTTVSNKTGFNISDVTFNGTVDVYFEVTFAQPFGDQLFAVSVNSGNGVAAFCCCDVTANNKVQIRAYSTAGTQLATWSGLTKFHLVAHGHQ